MVTASLAEKFRERKADTHRRLTELAPAIDAGDPEAIAEACRIAHGLNGVCAMFGQAWIGELAQVVEDLARDVQGVSPELTEALGRLRSALAQD